MSMVTTTADLTSTSEEKHCLVAETAEVTEHGVDRRLVGPAIHLAPPSVPKPVTRNVPANVQIEDLGGRQDRA